MLARMVVLAGGVSGAMALSQFPEFSQQYTQRLGGAVDELSGFVADFDADAAEVGLAREAALQQLAQGSALGAARADTMRATIHRYERLRDAQLALESAGPVQRILHARQFNDAEIAKEAWADFQPALPFTVEGLVFAGVGGVLGAAILRVLLGSLGWVFGRRKLA